MSDPTGANLTPGEVKQINRAMHVFRRLEIGDRLKALRDDIDSTGFDFKGSCRVASTANVDTTSAPANIDGVAMAAGDRVLLKDQTAPAENGIYVWNALAQAMTRATDADADDEVTAGMVVAIEEGTANADKVFMLTTNNPIVLGTTNLTFTDFGLSSVTAAAVLAALAAAAADIDVNGQNITNVGNVDGRDVSADGSALDTHVALTAEHVQFLAGTAGARPAFGTAGRYYYATDTGALSRDTGAAWEDLTVELGAEATSAAKVLTALAAAAGDVDVNGQNITNVGNVDGRDVSADGTKLDGVEALADVTDNANVVAALEGVSKGTSALMVKRCVYDFAVDGGAQGEITIDGGDPLPENARVVRGGYEMLTAFTSAGAATVRLFHEYDTALDVILAPQVAYNDASYGVGMHNVTPTGYTSAGSKVVSGFGDVKIEIGTADLTAGKLVMWLEYVIADVP